MKDISKESGIFDRLIVKKKILVMIIIEELNTLLNNWSKLIR